MLFQLTRKYFFCIVSVVMVTGNAGCRKLIEIDPPARTITTSQVFVDSVNAAAGLAGIYSRLINTGGAVSFGSGAMTIYSGLSSDELVNFSKDDASVNQFYDNTLQPFNEYITYTFWSDVYYLVYQINAVIEGVSGSSGISESAKNQFVGEAKFLRSYIYFYLVNIFGEVPLVSSTDYKLNSLAAKNSIDQVYKFIVKDLMDAKDLLGGGFMISGGERIRATKWSSMALLARVYLYINDYKNAEVYSTDVINSEQFSLVDDLSQVFLKNSSEAILQFQISSNSGLSTYNATPEGYNLIMLAPFPPRYYLSSELLNAFEPSDQRKIAWTNSTQYAGNTYYYPFKYKIGAAVAEPNAPTTEYYMVLRIAEQFLIRAEARARQNNLQGAVADMNAVRNRAGLLSISGSLSQNEILQAIAHERRIELFSEWGHRWLDLKRTNQVNSVMSILKPLWQPYQQLYPIPLSELGANPNLVQNTGY